MLSQPQSYIATSSQSINLFLAGMGAGKTHLDGMISAYFVGNFPNVKGFIGANTYDQLNTSTLYRIKAVWDEVLGMKEGTHYVCGLKPPDKWVKTGHYFDSYSNIISFSNGAVIFQGSLENAKSHEGKEFGWAILDETKDTREEDVKEIILMRLREKGLTVNGRPWNPLYITTSPAKVPWINEWFGLDEMEGEIKSVIYSETDFFKKEYDNKCVTISSTYHNQQNLPPNYIENKRFDLTTDQFNRMIYGDPFMKTGGEFYSSFDRQVHVKPCKPIEGVAVHLSFDQNVVPYITSNEYQITKEGQVYIVRAIGEICLPNPRNKTEALCNEIELQYGQLMKAGGMFYYGDASGKHRDTRGMETDYDIIERVLRKYISNSSNRVVYKNPSVNKRRMFINRIFEGKLPIRIEIDPKCKNLIADLEYIKETPEGTKHKQTVRDEKQGVSYEKWGHCFTGDTIVDGKNRIKDMKIGDITEFGKVLNVYDNGIQEVRTYDIEGIKIKCTPSHKIAVHKLGFTDSIDYICMEKLAFNHHYLSIKQNGEWKKKRLFIRDLNSVAIRALQGWQTKDITKVTLKSMVNGLKRIYIDLFGSGITVRYLPAIIFIILMGIMVIMNLLIWSALKALITLVTMLKTLHLKLKHFAQKFYGIVILRQGNGISQKLAMSGISNNLLNLSGQMKSENVKSAEIPIKRKSSDQTFVQPDVKTNIVQLRRGIDIKLQNLQSVKFVAKISLRFQKMLAGFAVGNVIKTHEKVYDLTIEGTHVYSANGILVHNCSDDLDYFLCSAFESYFNS